MLHPNWRIRRDTTCEELKRHFLHPEREYLPYAYWFWIDQDPKPEIYQQEAADLIQGGFALLQQDRGFRGDKDTYLACFDKAMEESRKAGVCLEYCEPAGGQRGLHLDDPDILAVSLACDPIDLREGQRVLLTKYFFAVTAQKTADGHIDSDSLALVTGEEYLASGDNTRFYGFTTYNDITGEGSNATFLSGVITEKMYEAFHKTLLERYPEDLGQTLAGYFFDLEGDYGYKLCWSKELEEEYLARTGRDFRLNCPLLLEEDVQGKWMRARYDFMDAVSAVYTRFTFQELSDRLEEKGMFMGGHIWEENLLGQTLMSGDPLRIYRAMTMPSLDHLMIGTKNIRTYKELQSVCELDGKRCGGELLSISGWETDPSDIRETVNNAIAHSISHFALHSVYSNREDISRAGYAQDFYDWAPMWEWNHSFADYMHRTSWMISQGQMAAEVMLYDPIESVWALLGDAAYNNEINYSGVWQFSKPMLACDFAYGAEMQRIDDAYVRAMYELNAMRISFLIGDRYYVNKAEVRDGRLCIGSHSFRTVVLPSVRILSLNVMEKLWDLLEDGGYVMFVDSLPTASAENGKDDPLMKEWIRKMRKHPGCTVTCEEAAVGVGLSSYLGSDMLPTACSFMKGEFALHMQHRIIDAHSFFWLANNNRRVQNCILFFPGQHGKVYLWNAETGARSAIASEDLADGSAVPLVFEASEGFFLEFDPSDAALTKQPDTWETAEIPVTGEWRIWIDPARQPRPTGYDAGVPEKFCQGISTVLMDWQELGFPHFSGCVEYEKTITLPENAAELEIDLGKVNYMARVWLDGQEARERLWGPYRFRFQEVSAGEHTIHVHVGNLMNNILEPHLFDRGEQQWHMWDPTPETFRSGIFGPVVLRYWNKKQVLAMEG